MQTIIRLSSPFWGNREARTMRMVCKSFRDIPDYNASVGAQAPYGECFWEFWPDGFARLPDWPEDVFEGQTAKVHLDIETMGFLPIRRHKKDPTCIDPVFPLNCSLKWLTSLKLVIDWYSVTTFDKYLNLEEVCPNLKNLFISSGYGNGDKLYLTIDLGEMILDKVVVGYLRNMEGIRIDVTNVRHLRWECCESLILREGNLLETMIVARWKELPLVEYPHLTHLSRIQMCIYDLWQPSPTNAMWRNNQEILKLCPKLRYYATSELCSISHPGIEWLVMTPEIPFWSEEPLEIDCPNLRVLEMRHTGNVKLVNSPLLETLRCAFSNPQELLDEDYLEEVEHLKTLIKKLPVKRVVLYNVDNGLLDPIPDLPMEPVYIECTPKWHKRDLLM